MASSTLVDICAASHKNCAATREDCTESCQYCVASRVNCAAVINAGAVPQLVKLFASTKNPMIAENCLGCLYNITDHLNNRVVVLNEGIIPILVEKAEVCLKTNRKKSAGSNKGTSTSNDKIACQIVRLYGNLCTAKKDVPSDLSTVKDFLPVLIRILSEFKDNDTLEEGSSAIYCLAHTSRSGGWLAAKSGVCTRLLELVSHPQSNVSLSALYALSNITGGGVACLEEVLKCGVLPHLLPLLNSSVDQDVLENIYNIIVNVCCDGTPNHIQQLIDAQFIPGLVKIAKDGPVDRMGDAINAFYGIACDDGGTLEQVEYLVEQGVLEALCYQLGLSTDDKIQDGKLDALERILDRVTNATSTSVCAGTRMVNAGAVPELIQLLIKTDNPTIADNSIQCLHYITCDTKNPIVVLRQGIVPVLVRWAERCLEMNGTEGAWENENSSEGESTVETEDCEKKKIISPVQMACHIICFYYDICKFKNDPVDSAILDFLPALSKFLNGFQNDNILGVGCQAIRILAYDNERAQLAVLKSGVCTYLVQLIMHSNLSVAKGALCATINISDKSTVCKEEVLKCGVLQKLVEMLNSSSNRYPLNNIYKLIRNLSKHPAHIQQIIEAQLIPGMILATKKGEADVRLEATRAIRTIIKPDRGTMEQVEYLVEQGALEALCHQLTLSTDEKTLTKKLNGLQIILERVKDHAVRLSGWQKRIERCGGLTQIEILQTHKNLDIYQKAYDLADKCFDCQLRKLKVRATYIEIKD